jgi:drug/metabolite transporter (DMT)-like permease
MVGYAVESGLFFAALKHGTAPAVTLLFFTYPVMVTLVAIARGKGAPAGLVAVSLGAAVGGAALVAVAGGGVDIDTTGALLAFAAAVMFTVYLTGADAVLHRTNSLTGAMWVSGAASVGLAVFAVASGTATLPHGSHQWAEVLGAGAFTSGAFVCLFAGLRRLGPVRTSIVAATEPLAATILAVLFLSTKLRPVTVGGGLLILSGAVIASLARKEDPPEAPVP